MSRRMPASIVRLAAALLPAPLRDWGKAMRAEEESIETSSAAFRFALGCLGCAIREAAAFHAARIGARDTPQSEPEDEAMSMTDGTGLRPRLVGLACAAGAVGLGFAYLAAAGAPPIYFVMNGAALVLGIALVAALGAMPRTGRLVHGIVPLALAFALLATALWGIAADGAARWVSIGGVALQPSLMFVPVLALRFARAPDGAATVAVVIAACALALQPDRAMAGALLAGTGLLVLMRPGLNMGAAFVAALAGFAVALWRTDASPAMPYVDQIFFSSFAVHPLAGMAVLAGSLLLVVPTLVGAVRDPARRSTYAVFGAVWLASITAAALGNYPTPLVGYGGSAIIGYLLGLAALPRPGASPAAADATGRPQDERDTGPRGDLSFSA
ncbi:MAG: hypothetical protein KF780_02795 [Sphingomonas sp.]|nr:hypothetical protein [Sphingomonas sp.]